MNFSELDVEAARGHYDDLLVEARILRLIRASQAANQAPVAAPYRTTSLIERILAALRTRPIAQVGR